MAAALAPLLDGDALVLGVGELHQTTGTQGIASSLARFTRLDHDAHTEWHTALRLITKHEPGALHNAIEPLRYHDVQMTSLHSRPIMGEPWRYQFYVDVVGHRSAARVLRALKDVSERSAELHVLGSYPVSRGVQ